MRVITLLILIAWGSTTLANELPPELPFQAVDGKEMPPYQEDITGGQTANTNQTPLNQTGRQMANETSVMQDQDQSQQPTEQERVLAQENAQETAQAPKRKKRPKKRPQIIDEAPTATSPSATFNNGPQSGFIVRPEQGRTDSVVIARGKLNRIVTPYANPTVLTVDNIETKIDGSAVYVATDSEVPVGLFISDTETGIAASLQLEPMDMMAPVEIRIEQDTTKASPTEAGSSRTDKLFRQDTPYITEIKAIMQTLGRQQIPQGFTLEEVSADPRSVSICHAANLTFIPGQMLSGHDARILIMVAQNNGLATSVFEEAYCAGEDIMAVAAWPKVRLGPGEKTEVYILLRLQPGKSSEEARPTLL